MAYDKFTVLKSTAVPLPIENVDTDQIIPARFLKATKREGFGDNLFRDWRYNGDDTPKADFVLNNPIYSGKILVGGKNFGSGSSREHAAWAIYDYYAFSAKADNARFDINANYQRLEYDEAQALAKAKSKLAEANSLRDQLNNNKCEKGCNP